MNIRLNALTSSLPIIFMAILLATPAWWTVYPEPQKAIQMPQQNALKSNAIRLKNEARRIFAVPVDNAVGTNAFSNGITIMHFNDKGTAVRYETAASGFTDEADGDFQFSFCAGAPSGAVTYTQDAWLIQADITAKKTREIATPAGRGDLFDGIHPCNASPGVFLLELQTPHFEEWERRIQLHRIDGAATRMLKEVPVGIQSVAYAPPAAFGQSAVFIYDPAGNTMKSFDESLTAKRHPFADAFNAHAALFRRIRYFSIHPTLPFAVLIDCGKEPDWEKLDLLSGKEYDQVSAPQIAERDRYVTWLLRWDVPDPKKQCLSLFSKTQSVFKGFNPQSVEKPEFSPEGSWLILRDRTQYPNLGSGDEGIRADLNPSFVAFRVDGANSAFLGEPAYLGRLPRKNTVPEGTAWTRNPLAFVVSDGDFLYKWDLR